MTPLRPALLALLLAGPAAAEGIAITGRAEMGLMGGSGRPEGARVQLLTDLDLLLRLSRTTDGGLTFGIEIDLENLAPDPARPLLPAPALPPPERR